MSNQAALSTYVTAQLKAPRILFVTTGLGGGGAENALLNLCGNIVATRAGARIIVICLLANDEGPIGAALRRLGVTVIPVMGAFRRVGLGQLARALFELPLLRPHVVQGWMYHGNAVAWMLRTVFFPDTRLVGSVHSLWSQPKHVSLVLRLARNLNRLGAKLDFGHTFFAGRASLEQHVKAGFPAAQSSVLPNGVQFDDDASGAIRSECEVSEVPMLVHVSRAHFDKDNENFLRTVTALETRRYRCDIVVLGAGLDAEFMDRELPEHRNFLYAKVMALGFRTDVRDFLKKASVMFLTSKSEAFPVSLVEGLGAGAVCVGTDVGDCGEIIGDCGATVPPGRPDLLADALVAWAMESQRNRRAWALRCRARAASHFSLETMGRLYGQTLTELDELRVL
jgi:glycosyltransferase involved in cell wall biosynthesis